MVLWRELRVPANSLVQRLSPMIAGAALWLMLALSLAGLFGCQGRPEMVEHAFDAETPSGLK